MSDARNWFVNFMTNKAKDYYHGTRGWKQINKEGFIPSGGSGRSSTAFGQGVYFSPELNVADKYSKGLRGGNASNKELLRSEPRVIKARLTPGLKIFDTNNPKHLLSNLFGFGADYQQNEMLKARGYDGLKVGKGLYGKELLIFNEAVANTMANTKGGPKAGPSSSLAIRNARGKFITRALGSGGLNLNSASGFLKIGMLQDYITKGLQEGKDKYDFIGPTIGQKDKDRVEQMLKQARKQGQQYSGSTWQRSMDELGLTHLYR